jgi:CBS domain containing-hemolysin-like protein
VLTAVSSFLAAGETALTGANRIRLKHKAEKSPAAKKALRLLEKYDRMLATLLIAVNVIAVVAASLATLFAIDTAAKAGWDEGVTIAVASAILTVVLIVVGDILPKTLARVHADAFVVFAAGALTFIMWIFIPISSVMLLLQRGVMKMFARGDKVVSVTEQELLQIIDEIEDEGVLEEHESLLVRSALEFDETTVEEILTPRVDTVAVALTDNADKVKEVFFREGYSRLPVYDGTLDKIVGVVSNKEFMKWLLSEDSADSEIPMQDIVRLPALMKLSDALKSMQKQKSHLAVVLDQHGGTAGIVTLEDILEELVGEIWDESDEETQPVKFTNANTFEVGSELSIIDFNRFFENSEKHDDIEIESESNTVGGYVFELFGKIPTVGESVTSEQFRVTVLSMEGRRLGRLRFEIILKKG